MLSFNTSVSTASIEDLYRSTILWVEQHCSLVDLRPAVLNSLRYLCTATDILADPARLPEEALAAVNRTERRRSIQSLEEDQTRKIVRDAVEIEPCRNRKLPYLPLVREERSKGHVVYFCRIFSSATPTSRTFHKILIREKKYHLKLSIDPEKERGAFRT
ncbi:MLX-interacting protein isoform X1 [Vespula squamosa]|uniref:MLX-interacting protein isoform X1 n=1 Tax=Vespula squamosa TaxID=30214 RepID=A0ABD2AK38_VESSQ